jgi:hypothetical protein
MMAFLSFGLATGTNGFGSCEDVTLPSPAATEAAVQSARPDVDMTLMAMPDVPLDGEVDTHACAGKIRPGARQSNGCTLSWILEDAQGKLYQTTAGHCTSSLGQQINAAGGISVGRVVFRVNGGVGNDIALIEIFPEQYGLVDPTLCHWGGPTKIATPADAEIAGNDAMLHYGWGVMWSQQPTRARVGVIPGGGWFADGSVRMMGFTDGGDSGSPMMLRSGAAAGVHTHTFLPDLLGFQTKSATRLDLMVPRIEATLGLDLDIVPGLPVDLTGLSIP